MNQGNIYTVSDTGLLRRNNEDRLLVSVNFSDSEAYRQTGYQQSNSGFACLCVVADGMGGENAGEVAAEIAADRIHQFISKEFKKNLSDDQLLKLIREAQLQAHKAIIQYTRKNPDCIGMGTTIILALFKNDKVYIGWTGDSRAYLFRKAESKSESAEESTIYKTGSLELLTNDHSLVWDEVIAGKLSPEQARISPMSNMVTQVLGDPLNIPKPDVRCINLLKNDLILLCSDGLSGMISDSLIHSSIDSHSKNSLEEIANDLLLQAKIGGGKDNISFVLFKHISSEKRLKVKTSRNMGEKMDYLRPLTIFIIFILFSSGITIGLHLAGLVDLQFGWEELIGFFNNKNHLSIIPTSFDTNNIKLNQMLSDLIQMQDTFSGNSIVDSLKMDSLLIDSTILKN